MHFDIGVYMKLHLSVDTAGNILYSASFASESDVPVGLICVDVEETGVFEVSKFYMRDGKLVEKPERPSEYHEWVNFEWSYNVEVHATKMRSQRDTLLAECDWTQLPDVDEQLREAWVPYRRALRDVPAQPGYPVVITWPVKPE